MNRIGFITNTEKDPELKYTGELVSWCVSNGCEVILNKSSCQKLGTGTPVKHSADIYAASDFVVVLGGDGTILRVAKSAAKNKTPILGVNFGTLGYLADVEKDDAAEAINKVLRGECKVEKRMMLDAHIERNGLSQDSLLALNEFCVNSTDFSRMVTLEIDVNEEYINTVRADGIIVSTPTGSTAYNLSAGGPILNPTTELMTITHMCPHALYARPLVVSGEDTVKIRFSGDYGDARITYDGQNGDKIEKGDTVVIRKSEYNCEIIKTSDLSFYDILRRKMVEVNL